MSNLESKIDDLVRQVTALNENVAIQKESINKLTESFDKIAVIIERLNTNSADIEKLEREIEKVKELGVSKCEVNYNKIIELEKKTDTMCKWLTTLIITFLTIFIGYVIERLHS